MPAFCGLRALDRFKRTRQHVCLAAEGAADAGDLFCRHVRVSRFDVRRHARGGSDISLVGRKALGPDNLAELLTWLKANPETATMGVPGTGSAPHIYGLFFERLSGARLRFIPYRGGAQMMQDLVAGQIDLTITTPVVSLAPFRAGSIKAYGVTAKERLPSAPEIPTAEEAGLPGYTTHNWTALWAPKGTPEDIVAKLNAAVRIALADPAVRDKLAGPGQDIFPPDQQSPEALAALQAAEIEKWWPVIKAANVTGQQ